MAILNEELQNNHFDIFLVNGLLNTFWSCQQKDAYCMEGGPYAQF